MNNSLEEIYVDERAKEIEVSFSYDGYQIVRREMFAHQREPAVVIRRDSITFNTACIDGLEDAVYIQILTNEKEHRLVIRKCDENDKDAVRWCIAKPDKRRSRKITGIFSSKLYIKMGWDTNCRYKILGHRIQYEGMTLYVFELDETEIFWDKSRNKNESEPTNDDGIPVESEDESTGGSHQRRSNRTPFYPEEWGDNFGIPVSEHRNVDFDRIDDYGVEEVKRQSSEDVNGS